MENEIEILQRRIEKAKAALREAKRREKEREQKRAFDLVRRSGLTLADLEKLLSGVGKTNVGEGEK